MTSTWFITGTSSDFGRELTERLLERGDRVAATLRKPSRLDDLANRYGDRLWVRDLDVTNTEQMREVVDAAFASRLSTRRKPWQKRPDTRLREPQN